MLLILNWMVRQLLRKFMLKINKKLTNENKKENLKFVIDLLQQFNKYDEIRKQEVILDLKKELKKYE